MLDRRNRGREGFSFTGREGGGNIRANTQLNYGTRGGRRGGGGADKSGINHSLIIYIRQRYTVLHNTALKGDSMFQYTLFPIINIKIISESLI